MPHTWSMGRYLEGVASVDFLRLAGGTAWRITRAVLSQVAPHTSAPREWLRRTPLALRGAQPGG
eukprot:8368475-Pyramimonas_sp.AAC.1